MRPSARALPAVEIDGELVCYDPETQTLHQLNATAALVWRMCDGASTVEEIVTRVAREFDCSVATVERDVRALVDRFFEQRLCDAPR
jgi:hypothetical protein